ncbi:MAG: transcription termination factor NusA [bacterium]
MAIQSDFMAAINQISAERKIDRNKILDSIKLAILNNYKTQFGEEAEVKVDLNEETGKISVLATKEVVKEVENEKTQIEVIESKKLGLSTKVGEKVEVDVTPQADFGRIAAQAARQMILQNIREVEKETIMKEFEGKEGTIETGIIQRMDGDNVLIEIRKAIAVMDAEDRIPGEFYKSANKIKVLVKKIEETTRGKVLKVSRSDPDFLKALFVIEVPEIESGSVEIKAIAREAGSRSKVAVYSNVNGVDPIGSCVGQKGVRIMTVTNELKFGKFEEKIDIILWDSKAETFISNSLSPAQTISVDYEAKTNTAKVIVPDEQLSLAIGKDGQNVRLAAKLCGVKIDIEGVTKKPGEDGDTPKEEVKDEKIEEK